MIRYYITDRRGLGGEGPLLDNIKRLMAAGRVDWIQIREKDLSGRDLLELARQVVRLATASGPVRVLINSRLDVALAAGAGGVHLPSKSPAAAEFRRVAPRGMLMGVSCHDLEELKAAEMAGADYAVLGPVYAPLSKVVAGPSLGLDRFTDLVRQVQIPVVALGGISWETIDACERAGASGIAGISLFQGLFEAGPETNGNRDALESTGSRTCPRQTLSSSDPSTTFKKT